MGAALTPVAPETVSSVGERRLAAAIFDAQMGSSEVTLCDVDLDTVADQGVAVTVQGSEVILLSRGGDFFAISGICPHKGARLLDGSIKEDIVTCPWHRQRFDLRTGECVTNPRLRLPVFEAVVDGSTVTIKSAASAE